MRRTSTFECRQTFGRKCTGAETETAAWRRELRETTCQKCSHRQQVRSDFFKPSKTRDYAVQCIHGSYHNWRRFSGQFRPKLISRNSSSHEVSLCLKTCWTQNTNMYWWRFAVYGRWLQTREGHSWTMLVKDQRNRNLFRSRNCQYTDHYKYPPGESMPTPFMRNWIIAYNESL